MDRRYIARLARDPPDRFRTNAQVAELVDALVSGISGAIRGGSSPLLGTNLSFCLTFSFDWKRKSK